MKTILKVAGIATLVAILGVAAIGAVAYAQDEDPGGPFDFGIRFREAVAGILGISVEAYDAAVEQAHEQVVSEALAEGWLTEDQAERLQERMEQGPGALGRGRGLMGPHMGLMGRGGESIIGVAAEKLDMSVQDLLTELQDGKSIADVAADSGVDPQDIIGTYLAQLEETLQQAVDDGKLTQNQADWILEQATERALEEVNGTWEGRHPGGFPGGKRPGGMWGFPGQTDA